MLKKVIEELKRNKQLREEGKYIGLPVPFPRMKEKFPYITKGRYIIVTANSKVGKTQITDFLFLYWPFIFQRELKTNLKFKIFYFSLEMSKEDKIKSAISFFLSYYKGIVANPDKISSQYDNYILDNNLLSEIEDISPLVDEFLSMVEFIDETRNPFGIYKHCQDWAEQNGSYTYKTIKWKNETTGQLEDRQVIDQYIPNDPDVFPIVITDHVSLLAPENGKTPHESLGEFSAIRCLKLRDRFKFLVVNVQQQAQAQESVENAKLDMLRPSHNGLGDNKMTGRDCDLMFGLFSPFRFKRTEHEGYDIKQLQDNYREFLTILNRRGGAVATDLYFDGEVNYFKELPPSEKMTGELYKKLKEKTFNRTLI
jgi:hypothetical protein